MHRLVPIVALNALVWTLCTLAIIFTFGRLYLRFKKFKTLVWDDILNLTVLVALIGFMATYQVYFPPDHESVLYTLGLSNTVPPSENPVLNLKLKLANIMLFWVVIFLVKASFLALYWILFNVSSSFRKAWWAVAIYTFVTFWAIFLASLWLCGSPKGATDPDTCDNSSEQIIVNIESIWCVLNVIGDILILALPLGMLRSLRIVKSQKLGLAAIFAIVIIDIVLDILRTVYTNSAILNQYFDLNAAWDLCEPNIAVIVCSLPSYRMLLAKKSSESAVQYHDTDATPFKHHGGLSGVVELEEIKTSTSQTSSSRG